MLRKTVSGIMLTLLLISMLALAFDVSLAWRGHWIWNTGGSFEMPTSWEYSEGLIEEYENIPWGDDYWGLHAYSWGDDKLYYDDGTAEDGYAPTLDLYTYAVHFQTPENTIYKVVDVKYYIYSDPASFYVDIRDESLQPLYYEVANPLEEGWFTINLSSEQIFVEGDFYVALKYITLERPKLGADYDDPDGESGEGVGFPAPPNISSLDWMIRATLRRMDPVFPVGYYYFALSDSMLDGHSLVMEGHETEGKWGTVTCVQGDVWNWKNIFPEKMWNEPIPISYLDDEQEFKDLIIEIDVRRLYNGSLAEPGEDDRIMYAIDVWLSSPELPLIPNKTQTKPLVLDIIFYLGEDDKAESFVDDYGYHYQVKLPECPIESHVDTSITIPLTAYIYNALREGYINWADPEPRPIYYIENVDRVEETLRLYQLEFLLEVQRAYAACAIDNFYLRTSCPTDVESLWLADLNKDGRIRVDDVLFVALQWGNEVPPVPLPHGY